MSNFKEAWERDLDWLAQHFGYVDGSEADDFCERVAILVADGTAETPARYQAMVMIRDKRNGRHQ